MYRRKSKIFAWKIASNCLATMENKVKRKLERIATCTVCGTEVEDTIHALCRCPLASHLWSAMQKAGNISSVPVGCSGNLH
jgi:hypothetical protein